MIRHVVRLIWNRKRQNALLLVEILCAFLVVVAVAVFGLHIVGNTRKPVGFTRTDVWNLEVGRGESHLTRDQQAVLDRQIFLNVFAELDQLPEVIEVAGGFTGPYINSSWGTAIRLPGGGRIGYSVNRVTDGFKDVMRLTVVDGRWFSQEDNQTAWDSVVVNRRMAVELFGDSSPVGKIIDDEVDVARLPPGSPLPVPKKVVGVIDEFRQSGELATPENYLFHRMDIEGVGTSVDGSRGRSSDHLPGHIFLRMAPGTTAAFEEALLRRLGAVAPAWSFNVQPIDAIREQTNRQFLVPITVLGVIAISLLVMVALGLTGVVWQSVTQRTREFGLRRAAGAAGLAVRAQVLMELVALTTLAMLVGGVLLLQLPLIPLPSDILVVSRTTFLAGVALSVSAIYFVTILCGWYPSRLATRVPPAEALHYE